MNLKNVALTRRDFLTLSASTGLLGLMPTLSYANTIKEMQGRVWVNNDQATLATVIKPGDIIITGPNSSLIFVIEEDVYKLGPRSTLRLQTNAGSGIVQAMRFISGAFTAVFGSGEKDIHVPSATIGIRGTGFYLQKETNSTYFCTCYGETEIATNTLSHRQQVSATHHQAYSIANSTQNKTSEVILPQTMRGHSDQDLIDLEALVGRRPPASFK